MSHVAFDTLKFVKKLEAAGIPEQHAAAIVEAQNEAFIEASENIIATKSDINKLDKKVSILQWMMGFMLAGIASLVIKAFFS